MPNVLVDYSFRELPYHLNSLEFSNRLNTLYRSLAESM
jgi:hypothetical protein